MAQAFLLMLGRALLLSNACCLVSAARHSFVSGVATPDLAEAPASDDDYALLDPAVVVAGGDAQWDTPSARATASDDDFFGAAASDDDAFGDSAVAVAPDAPRNASSALAAASDDHAFGDSAVAFAGDAQRNASSTLTDGAGGAGRAPLRHLAAGAAGALLQAAASTRARFGLDFQELASHPDQLLAVCYAVPCVVWFLAMIRVSSAHLREQSRKVAAHKAQLKESFDGFLGDMESLLDRMVESSSRLAEQNLDGKRRDFQKFLQAIARRPTVASGDPDAVANELRRFVGCWLKVFEECSKDPVHRPTIVAGEWELARAETCPDLCALVQERLDKHELNFIAGMVSSIQESKKVDSFKNEGMRPQATSSKDRGCFGCSWFQLGCCLGCGWRPRPGGGDRPSLSLACCLCRITFLSVKHVMVVGAVVCGFAVMAVQAHARNYLCVAVVGVAELCVMSVMVRFEDVDTLARLQADVNQLEREHEDVRQRCLKLKKFSAQMQNISTLWRYRTVPLLDLLKELHEQLWDTPAGDLLAVLEGLNGGLECALESVGPLTLYTGQSELSEDVMSIISTRLYAVTNFIKENSAQAQAEIAPQVARQLKSLFAFINVHVVAAHDLGRSDWSITGGSSDPFVRLRVREDEEWLRTEVVMNNLNPRFNEEFLLAANPEDSVVTLEVRDWDKFSKSDALGRAELKFRDLKPGQWHALREPLHHEKKKNKAKGEIEVKVHFATTVPQLERVAHDLCRDKNSPRKHKPGKKDKKERG